MTHRRRLLNSTLALGGLVDTGFLAWTATTGADGDETIPARPQAVAIDVAVESPAAEPLPRILVPALTPQVVPEPGHIETEIRLSPRPVLVLADLDVPRYREDLPSIAVPELLRPQCRRANSARA